MTDPEPEPGTPGVPERGERRKLDAEPPAPARVMSIHAHPDDQEFTVGGTLAKWARAGSTIVTVCITSGNGGSRWSMSLPITAPSWVAPPAMASRTSARTSSSESPAGR